MAPRLDDLLAVSVQYVLDGRTAAIFSQQIHRDGIEPQLLVDAQVRVVCVDSKTLRPRRIAEYLQ